MPAAVARGRRGGRAGDRPEGPGWHVIGVEEDTEGLAFAYSIGLNRSFEHPEMIIFGLQIPVMHRIIHGVGKQTEKG
jgi:hypothetical protein